MTAFAEPKAPTFQEWSDHRATLSEKDDVLFISHETPNFENASYLLTCYVAETDIDGIVLTAEDFEDGEFPEEVTPEAVILAVEKVFEEELPEVTAHNRTGADSFHLNGAEFSFEVDEDEVTVEFAGF